MKKSYKTETLIQQAVNVPTKKEHHQIFKELRREGMFKYNVKAKYNVKESGRHSLHFQRDRCFCVNNNDGVISSKCIGMFSRKSRKLNLEKIAMYAHTTRNSCLCVHKDTKSLCMQTQRFCVCVYAYTGTRVLVFVVSPTRVLLYVYKRKFAITLVRVYRD